MHERSADLHYRWAALLAATMIALGAGRIASTYLVLSHVFDEPAHIAAGMEWLDRRLYTYEVQHPPLARVAAALIPWLTGSRSVGQPSMWEEGNAILYAEGAYVQHLASARLGILPFFLLAAGTVWAWARLVFGAGFALGSVFLFTTLPPVLAHAGLATTDMAVGATLPAAVFLFARWLDQPTPARCAGLGFMAALTVLSKLSALVLLPSCMVGLIGWRWAVTARRNHRGHLPGTRTVLPAGLQLPSFRGFMGVVCVALFTLWGGYRFNLVPALSADARPHHLIDRIAGPSGPLHDLAYTIAEAPLVPLSELANGIAAVAQHNADGHRSYLLGQTSEAGSWWFFPVSLAVKTPVPFLLLTALGCIFSLKASWREGEWKLAVPALCAVVIFLVVLPSRINIGVRYILPIYPLLAITAGVGLSRLTRLIRPPMLGRVLAVLLLGWQLASSLVVHPDYLAYFNEVAGRRPERILVDSDLDWGQDVHRLRETLRQFGVTEVIAMIHGHPDEEELRSQGIPAISTPSGGLSLGGWVAVSIHWLQVDPDLSQLRSCDPVAKVGKSINLYRLTQNEIRPAGQQTIPPTEAKAWCR
ncbi:glycosyltransferase family 39 protein [Roseomonas sp. KE2513]|uniref:glycosyltransferase family 39 protein n=1 Tax=Roseomonas sp. KE2513 TaxID=2479202 RepID=UPI0018E05152|nr:glycosyltransferase family 39 protein [Roseomonas sp. KE2513]